MEKTPNLGLEVGSFALDGGQEGAMKRNMQKIDEAIGGGGGTPSNPTWDQIENKPAVIAAGADQGEARQAIGAGTSNFSGSYDDLSNKPSIPAAPAAGTDALLTSGTDTTQRTWSAKQIADYVAAQIAAIPPAG